MDINLIDENILFVSLIVISDILLGLWVYFSNPKSETNRQFFLLTLLLLLWAVFCYAKSILPQDISITLVRSAYAVVALFFMSFYFFLNNFPRKGTGNLWIDRLVVTAGIILALFPFYGPMVDSMIVINSHNIPVLGDGRFFYLGTIAILISFITIRFYGKYLSLSIEEKLKAQYFFIGFALFIGINFIFNIVIPLIKGNARYSCFGNHSAILFLVLTSYAIVKHELLGIKTLVTQILIGIISSILLLDIVFLSHELFIRLLKIGVLLVFVYCGNELTKSVRKEVEVGEKILKINKNLAERNRDLRILLRASDMVSQGLDPRKISQDIVDSVPDTLKHLGYVLGVIVLYKSEKDCVYVYAVTNSPLARKMENETHTSIANFCERLSKNNDLMVKAVKNGKMYASSEVEAFLENFMDANKSKEAQRVIDARSLISVPLFSAGKAIGAIIFLNQNGLDSITKRNKAIAKAFAAHIGPAIENAKLYEKTKVQMKELSASNKNLKKVNAQLKDVLALKDEFLHITSHQLRTPLTAIRGMLSMWVDGDYEKLPLKEKEEMIRRIYSSADRLNNITNEMLDAAELEGGLFEMEFKKVSLMEIINDAISTLRPNYERKGLYLRLEKVDKDIPEIEAEPNYMSQVFLNLIDNACKYTRTGGTEIEVRNSGKFIDVYIRDTGIGMDKKVIKKAYEKFTRGDNAVRENASGSGLGLFIAKKVLDAHNGKIAVHSAGPDKGTTFKVSLLIKQKQTYGRGKNQDIAKGDK